MVIIIPKNIGKGLPDMWLIKYLSDIIVKTIMVIALSIIIIEKIF